MGQIKIGMISLGCARNLVDSEIILGRLKQKGFSLVDIDQADIGIINTCAFIREAKEESLDTIQQVIALKQKGKLRKIIVTGCLPQRYHRELLGNLEQIDAFMGRLSLDDKLEFEHHLLTRSHFAYVKICESCVNRCSYCVIPRIKGRFTSRTIESVIEEVGRLDKNMVREINLIGQDTTYYGQDIYHKASLPELIERIIARTENIKWVRLLYTHPSHFNDELLEQFQRQDKLCKYIDLPLQHINDRILKLMNRNITREDTLRFIDKIRRQLPGVAIRTSMIVGFPTETDKEFEELLNFLKEQRFERLGAFIYSREEGTAAYDFPGQVRERVKQERFDRLMSLQQEIAAEVNQRLLHQEMEVLIDEKEEKSDNIYLGRTRYDAPEVDGLVYVKSGKKLQAGDLVKVKITDTLEYDLVGEAR